MDAMNCTVSSYGCGFGHCEDDRCVCTDGWDQSLEMFHEEGRVLKGAPCLYQKDVIAVLYAVEIVMFLLGLMFQVFITDTRKQFRRTLPVFVAYLLAIVGLARRILGLKTVRYGEDKIFTIFCTNALGLFFSGTNIFLAKYVKYILGSVQYGLITKSRVLSMADKISNPKLIIGVFVVVVNGTFTASTFVENMVVKRTLIKTGLVVIGTFCIMNGIMTHFTMTAAKKALAVTAQLNKELGKEDKLARRIKRQIVSCSKIRVLTIRLTFLLTVICLGTALHPVSYALWMYTWPIAGFTWAVFLLVATIAAWTSGSRKHKRNQNTSGTRFVSKFVRQHSLFRSSSVKITPMSETKFFARTLSRASLPSTNANDEIITP